MKTKIKENSIRNVREMASYMKPATNNTLGITYTKLTSLFNLKLWNTFNNIF